LRGKGVFICVEGLDGSGKTTQTRLLVRRLRKKGYPAIATAEPSRGKIGKFIKEHYLHGEKRSSSTVEALLFAADRFEHVQNEVKPCLDLGKIVVSDRYYYSSFAYQGAAGLELEWIKNVNSKTIHPDLALFIDVAPENVVERLKRKKSVMENMDTQKRVRDFYLKFVAEGELVRIDGNGSKEQIADLLLKEVLSFLGSPWDQP
jgi:dTMP kinase